MIEKRKMEVSKEFAILMKTRAAEKDMTIPEFTKSLAEELRITDLTRKPEKKTNGSNPFQL